MWKLVKDKSVLPIPLANGVRCHSFVSNELSYYTVIGIDGRMALLTEPIFNDQGVLGVGIKWIYSKRSFKVDNWKPMFKVKCSGEWGYVYRRLPC